MSKKITILFKADSDAALQCSAMTCVHTTGK